MRKIKRVTYRKRVALYSVNRIFVVVLRAARRSVPPNVFEEDEVRREDCFRGHAVTEITAPKCPFMEDTWQPQERGVPRKGREKMSPT